MNLPLAVPLPDVAPHPTPIIGLATIARLGFSGQDLQPLRHSLADRIRRDPEDVGALHDLSIIELIAGRPDNRHALQVQALAKQRLYRLAPAVAAAKPLRLLAFMTPGDFMANTPVEFLLEEGQVQLDILYVTPGEALPTNIPDHDVAFVAIAESPENQTLLAELETVVKSWPRPILNLPRRIARLTRDGAFALLHNVTDLLMPANVRVSRGELRAVAMGAGTIDRLVPCAAFPIIVRPLASHGGQGLEKLDYASALPAYLERRPEAEFYIAPFVDYRSAGDLYRKYRIALINGRAYGCHLAISRHWMVHYLNADMLNNPLNRAEEGRFLSNFDEEFGLRHKATLAAIAERTELDYAQIDCTETADGRLLLFEIGTAMIIHSMDPADIFPYKKAAMSKAFSAFVDLLAEKAAADQHIRFS